MADDRRNDESGSPVIISTEVATQAALVKKSVGWLLFLNGPGRAIAE